MKRPFVSRRRHDDLRADHQHAIKRLAQASKNHETFRAVVAEHIVAAGRPSTVVHDVTKFAESLREALEANGVDLRPELVRLEGADL